MGPWVLGLDKDGPQIRKTMTLYDEMDSNIVSLVKALNAFDGIYTISSCGGHRNNKSYQLPRGRWDIFFRLKPARVNSPSVQAWLTLELLAYAFSKCFDTGKGNISLTVSSPSPFLNGPGECISFILKGKDVDPDVLANWLVEFRQNCLE